MGPEFARKGKEWTHSNTLPLFYSIFQIRMNAPVKPAAITYTVVACFPKCYCISIYKYIMRPSLRVRRLIELSCKIADNVWLFLRHFHNFFRIRFFQASSVPLMACVHNFCYACIFLRGCHCHRNVWETRASTFPTQSHSIPFISFLANDLHTKIGWVRWKEHEKEPMCDIKKRKKRSARAE